MAKVGRKDPGEFYNPRVRKIVRKQAKSYLRYQHPSQGIPPMAIKKNVLRRKAINQVLEKHGQHVGRGFLTGSEQELRRAKKKGYY